MTAESILLNISERDIKNEAEKKLQALMREEEMKWALRAKVSKIVQGDDNTQFFHMIANGKHRKKKTIQLEQDEGTIVGHENLKLYISNFYQKLFGAPEENFVSLHEHVVKDLTQLGADENEVMSEPLSKKDVFEAITQMKNNKAPSPDGFQAEFYKRCWHVIKVDLTPMFHDLFNGQLQLFHLNFGANALLPRKEEVVRIE